MNKQTPIKIHKESYDTIVVGCGLAGLTAAFRAADAGLRVLLVSKTHICSGSSFYGLMDTIHCQATIDEDDEDVFLNDILSCSAHMNDTWMNQYYIKNIRSCISYLERIGISFKKIPEPKLPCFGKHAHDLFYWTDWDTIRKSIRSNIEQHPNISLAEQTVLFGILQQKSGAVCGACFYKKNTNSYETFFTRSIILSTGGFGALYKHNLNSPDVSGDGQALALVAGASLINLEFNQFIPGFISPGYKIVFREGSLDYCDGLFDSDGKNVLYDYFSSPEKMNECLKQRAFHGPFTSADNTGEFDFALLDAALKSDDNGVSIHYRPEILQDDRSYIKNYINWLQDHFSIDISTDIIKIAPFFHAANGGILVNHACQSTVPGLFACGECAGGIHGADRLGGNASGSCLVFGTLAAKSAVNYIKEVDFYRLSEDEILLQLQKIYRAEDNTVAPKNLLSPNIVIEQIKELMWKYCNVRRNQSDLDFAQNKIRMLHQNFNPWQYISIPQTKYTESAIQAEHFLILAEAIILSMSERKESRGGHYRSDFPQINSNWDKRIVVSMKNGSLKHEFSECKDTL